MAIDLLNSFLQRGQNLSSKQTGTKAQVQIQAAQNTPHNMQVMRAIRALQAGSTLQGEIVSVKGEEVQLAIMKDVIIDARLAQSMNLTQGMTMAFQVKANNSQGLSLVPLFMNTSVDPNAIKALDMAGIGVNERSLEMVQTLMERGMPIDKNTIQEIYRDVVSFKDGEVKDIVSLHQLELPVTKENLAQILLYHNNQHFLADNFKEMGKGIGEYLEQLVSQHKGNEAVELLQKLENFFGATREGLVSGEADAVKKEEFVETALLKGESTELTENEKELMAEKDLAGQREEKSVVAENGKLWNQLADLILKQKNANGITKLFEKIWNREIGKQWMLEPETLKEKEKVVEFYDKLTKQVKQLEEMFEQGSLAKSEVARAIHNTSSNLDFINQLHQFYAYIQLPLKMRNQAAQGELYVFTNRRTLNKKEGRITALLHLDMEYLGKMDVYVALENKKVSTNFYLEKEEYLEFLEAHMDMLTDRINKRGYSCEIKTALRDVQEGESVMKVIEKEQNQPMLLSMQAFDMRA